MLIDLRNLLSGNDTELDVTATIDMEKFDTSVNCYDIVKKEPVTFKLTKLDKATVEVKCSGDVTLSIPCDRCLELVDVTVGYDVDRIVNVESGMLDSRRASDRDSELYSSGGELYGGLDEDEEQDFVDGYNLDVDKLLFGEILLNLPGKVLCRESCKGLCSVCGNNLNIRDCGCERESLDPRMSIFKDITIG